MFPTHTDLFKFLSTFFPESATVPYDSRHQLTLRDYVTHDAFSSAQTTSLRDNLLIEGHLIHR